MLAIAIIFVLAYFLGSIPSAVLVCKLMNLPDPRTQGSGNPGASNVLRIGGKLPALLTLAGDALKGAIPVLMARFMGLDGFVVGLVAVVACLGHVFPVFLKFKGGKAVATAFGGLLALSLPVALVSLVIWAVVAAIFRYSSLAALVAAAVAPVFALLFGQFNYILPMLMIAALIVWRHSENIRSLRAGTERKLSF